jgi:hypothetical protein
MEELLCLRARRERQTLDAPPVKSASTVKTAHSPRVRLDP